MTPPDYETLYNDFHGKYSRDALRYLINKGFERDVAEDINQDTWQTVWENFSELRDPKAFFSWFRAIQQTTISNHWKKVNAKKRGGNITLLPIDPDDYRYKDDSPNQQDQILQKETLKKLRSCWAKLSKNARLSLSMMVRNARRQEIATLLGIDKTNVSKHLTQGRKQLKDCMEKSEDQHQPVSDEGLDQLILEYTGTLLFEDEHLTEDTLNYFITGLLDKDEMEEVREHLAVCELCRSKWRELMYIDSLTQQEITAGAEPEPEEKPQEASPPVELDAKPKPNVAQNYGMFALAAAIIFSVLYVHEPVEPLVQDPAGIQQPLNAPTYSVEPLETVRRGAPERRTTIAANTAVTLQLIYVEEQPVEGYRIQIVKPEDQSILLQIDPVVADEAGTFSIFMPANQLVPGVYVIQLLGDDELVSSYPITVR
ncbi:MAG: RNA polymerase sigma factor [Kangiellaceae bacterium]|nr:RNA polymerase sigma factor [Kangiellaceae bacterium]